MQPIHDNVEFLTSVNADRGVETYDDLRRKGVIEVEALT
jgi:predicted ribonuclease YlaK